MKSAHISVDKMADIAEDRATAEAREAAMAHISTCSSCDDILRRLERVILLMKSDSTKDAPRDVLTSAMNIFSEEKLSPLRRIVALLTFDSSNADPAYGMRSLRAASRQMLFSAEETDLDLRITVQNGECILVGQVLGNDCGGGLIEISGVAGTAEATLNEVGEFTLPPVPLGNYSLIITMPDLQIEIPELELKVS